MREILMVDLVKQHEKLQPYLDQTIKEVVNSSNFINGEPVKEFSTNLAAFLNVPFVICCANGTDALQLSLMALPLQKGDEVIIPAFNYVSAAEAATLLGLKVVFADVDPLTFNLSSASFEEKITPKTRAVIPTHLFGQSADMEEIMRVARERNIYVIEDTAQSLGAVTKFSDGSEKMAGTMGNLGITSFFPTKNLGCMGDGGAVFTHDPELAARIRILANHGQKTKYDYREVGINSRLDSLQAAILSLKLKFLKEYTNSRGVYADYYDAMLRDFDLQIPYRSSFSSHVFNQYTIRVNAFQRDNIIARFKQVKIPFMIYYPSALHKQQAYYRKETLPVSESLCASVLSLPMHTELDEEQQSFISENLLLGLNLL